MVKSNSGDFDPESAIIDAELLVKYRMLNRAVETLERAIDNAPRHIGLREKLREILIDSGRRDHAAQQCLALASLHISSGDLERANERLLEAKRLDPRVSVTGQLRDLRRTDMPPERHPHPAAHSQPGARKVLMGQLADISLFDIIQILENSRLNGAMRIQSSAANGEIHLTDGRIVNAKCGAETGLAALGHLSGAVDGTFEFEKTDVEYEQAIQSTSNTALILDMLRAKDEEAYGLNPFDTM